MVSGKVAVVTGGAMGIGKATARAFLDEGEEVIIIDIAEEAGQETAEELGCTFREGDVRDFAVLSSIIDETVDEFGQLDVMVNNAGIGSETSVGEMSLQEWRAVIDTNLDGVMHGCKAALPHLRDTEGSIVNVESIYGLRGGKGAAAYAASKGGVVNFTQQVAVDYAAENIRVNGVCPGFVRTAMTEDLLEIDRFYEFVKGRTPMNRVAEPEEIAPTIVFLASEQASYITGANIPVDGGWTAF